MRTVVDSVEVGTVDEGARSRAEAALSELAARYPRALFDRYQATVPQVHDSAWVFPGSALVGDVRLGPQASVWYGAVLRADLRHITVGARSNVQDGAVVHLGDLDPTEIGDDVTIGHGAVVHGCRIEDAVLIGIRSTILDGAVVGRGSVIGAGAVVLQRAVIPPFSLVLGMPARVVKTLPSSTEGDHRALAGKYVRLATNHRPTPGG